MSRAQRLLVLLVLAVGAVAVAGWRSIDRGGPVTVPQCGHWAVFRTTQILGAPAMMSDVIHCLPPHADGHSLADLTAAFQSFGLEGEARRERFETFLISPLPCVIHLTDPDHFVVAARSRGASLLCFDGTGKRVVVPLSALRERWTGYMLRVRRPVEHGPDPGGGRLAFETLFLDEGDVDPRVEELTFPFPFVNHGDQPVTISEVHPSCGCMRVDRPTGPVLPGESGVIAVTYRVSHKEPTFYHETAVESDDPLHPLIVLCIGGNVDTELYWTPRSLEFSPALPDERQYRLLFVHYHGEQPLALQARNVPPAFSAELFNSDSPLPAGVWEGMPEGARLPRGTHLVVVALTAAEFPREQKLSLTFGTNLPSRSEFTVPIEFKVPVSVATRDDARAPQGNDTASGTPSRH